MSYFTTFIGIGTRFSMDIKLHNSSGHVVNHLHWDSPKGVTSLDGNDLAYISKCVSEFANTYCENIEVRTQILLQMSLMRNERQAGRFLQRLILAFESYQSICK